MNTINPILAALLECIKYALPSFILLFYANKLFLTYTHFLEQKQRNITTAEQQKSNLPLRFQALERLILLAERLQPESLVQRLNDANFNVAEIQYSLITSIRAEYEHNLTQQLYVDPTTWEAIKVAKEQLLQLVILSAKDLNPNDQGIQLCRVILSNSTNPMEKAIVAIKNEVASIFK